jgi:hypothetical protein
MSTELFTAAEKTFGLAGHKAKDIPQVLATLKAEYNVDAVISGGMLKLSQGDTVMDIGASLATYKEKHPRDFYGSTQDVTFKQDIADDTAAKVAYIKEHGYDAWAALPLNEKSAGAKNAVTSAIPSAYMTAVEYGRLSIAERTKLAAEVGPDGIGRILNRKK